MISLAFASFIGLMIFSFAISYQWVKAKARQSELEEKLKIANTVLEREQRNREMEKLAYETRLEAKQSTIESLKKYLLAKVGNSGPADFITSMCEPEPDDGGGG